MKCISIRQPWAWLIIHGGKDIENRNWPTKVSGRVLIHAAKGMTHEDCLLADLMRPPGSIPMPPLDGYNRGGIIGSIEIVDCVNRSDSPWFVGRYGFVLRDPKPLPFRPLRGMLGFFDVPEVQP